MIEEGGGGCRAVEPAGFSVDRVYMCVCASNAYVFVFVLVQAYVFVPTHDGVQGATAEFSLRAGPT